MLLKSLETAVNVVKLLTNSLVPFMSMGTLGGLGNRLVLRQDFLVQVKMVWVDPQTLSYRYINNLCIDDYKNNFITIIIQIFV